MSYQNGLDVTTSTLFFVWLYFTLTAVLTIRLDVTTSTLFFMWLYFTVTGVLAITMDVTTSTLFFVWLSNTVLTVMGLRTAGLTAAAILPRSDPRQVTHTCALKLPVYGDIIISH